MLLDTFFWGGHFQIEMYFRDQALPPRFQTDTRTNTHAAILGTATSRRRAGNARSVVVDVQLCGALEGKRLNSREPS